MSKPVVNLLRLSGLRPFDEVWKLQRKLVELNKLYGKDYIIMVEHSHVYTAGRRSHGFSRTEGPRLLVETGIPSYDVQSCFP